MSEAGKDSFEVTVTLADGRKEVFIVEADDEEEAEKIAEELLREDMNGAIPMIGRRAADR